MELIFTPDNSGTTRAAGYATIEYSSDAENETVVETTEDNLTTIFEKAKSDGETLDGANESMDAAVENPLTYIDYLVLEAEEIIFDPEYTRENK